MEIDKKSISIAEMEKGSKNYLLKNDRATLGNFNNDIREFLDGCNMVQTNEKEVKKKAIDLIALLKEEYQLK